MLACPGEPDAESVTQPPTRQEALAALEVQPAPAPIEAPEAPEELVPVEITWDGIGPLHKGYFQDREAMTQLSGDLAPWLSETVQLHIRYDSEEFIGDIVIRIPPGELRTLPAVEGGRVELAPLAPLTTALGTYRDALAARFDLRIASFRIGLETYRGPTHCRFGAAGTHPPDGTVVSPCVLINGIEHCGLPEAGGVRFDTTPADQLEVCLGE